jgi:hypothetical protein
MNALNELENSKQVILSVLSEHYFLSSEEKKTMTFDKLSTHKCSIPHIEHGAWAFCYHRDVNKLYVKDA